MYLSMSSPAAGSTKSHSLPPLTPARSVSLKGYRLHQPHHLPQRHTSTVYRSTKDFLDYRELMDAIRTQDDDKVVKNLLS